MKKKALFLDRDGVINESPGAGRYVLSRADFRLRPAIIPLMRFARAAGYLIVVVTNQRAVSRGFLTIAGLEDIHAHMRELLAAEGVSIDAIYSCMHGFDECECRKPKPGMFFDAAHDLDVDLKESVMVGDHDTDIAAGTAAGCKLCLLLR